MIGYPQSEVEHDTERVGARQRALLLALRSALLIALQAIEVYLGLDPSREPRRNRKARERLAR